MTPSSNDHVTIPLPCPACSTPFRPAGKQIYCSNTCRVAAHRRRHHTAAPPATPLPPRPATRRPITVYECDTCDTRQLGQQRCDCGRFARKVGYGGHCPSCDDIHTTEELLTP